MAVSAYIDSIEQGAYSWDGVGTNNEVNFANSGNQFAPYDFVLLYEDRLTSFPAAAQVQLAETRPGETPRI